MRQGQVPNLLCSSYSTCVLTTLCLCEQINDFNHLVIKYNRMNLISFTGGEVRIQVNGNVIDRVGDDFATALRHELQQSSL